MNKFLACLSLLLIPLISNALETNGVFYIDNNVECHQISQKDEVTNQLILGKTYMVGNTILEMHLKTPTIFYFSSGLIIKGSSNSVFSINSFEQEVKNLNDSPSEAQTSNYNLSIQLNNGEFSVINNVLNENSTLSLSTQFSEYITANGKYYFRTSDKSAIVYVLDGIMNINGNTNSTDVLSKDNASFSVADPINSTVLNNNHIQFKKQDIDKFTQSIMDIQKNKLNIKFVIINGSIVGIKMNTL